MTRFLLPMAMSASFGAVGCIGAGPVEPPQTPAAPVAAAPPPAPVQPIVPAAAPDQPIGAPNEAWASINLEPAEFTFPSGGLSLHGVYVKPAGDGPFPTILWNHGSEPHPKLPGRMAKFWVAQGWALVMPFRRGHTPSPGTYYKDVSISPFDDRKGWEVAELERHQEDVQAAATFARTLAFVDRERMVVAGGSFGGIETLLAAERGTGFKAAIEFAGAAMSWHGNPKLVERLRVAARRTRIPIFYIQAENDFSTEPTRELSQEAAQNGRVYQAKIYPPNGTSHEDGHHLCVARPDVWGPDVLGFLKPLVR